MSIQGIFSSRSQQRKFLQCSIVIILMILVLLCLIQNFSSDAWGWNLLKDVLIALLASIIFVIVGTLYVKYFFKDPHEIAFASRLLPEDIDSELTKIAKSATEYRLFVRTGRHFRAKILDLVKDNAISNRRLIKIEAILLDFRDCDTCEQYASYRRSSSFDRYLWSKEYVQKQILATIQKMIQVVSDHSEFVQIDLYLNSRLSTFRYDVSQDYIIVTREDPKDVAFRFRNSDKEYAAYSFEFRQVLKDACKFEIGDVKNSPRDKLRELFGESPIVSDLEEDANIATRERSPYVR